MKIAGLTEAMRFLNQVREKPDQESASEKRQDGREREKNPSQSNSGDSGEQASPEKVQAALESFSNDPSTQGLFANAEQTSAGLRVVLRDIQGNRIRQLTGEEFVKLREVAGKDARTRGKILDQKL